MKSFKNRFSRATLILAIAGLLLGCSIFSQAGRPTPIPSPGAAAAPRIPSSAGASTAHPPPTATPSTLEAALQTLDRFRIHFQLSASGKDPKGKDQSGSLEIVQEVNHPDQTQHVNFKTSGIATQGPGSVFDLFQQKDQVYLVIPQGEPNAGCTGFSGSSIDLSAFSPITPESLVGNLSKGRLVQKGEQIDGQTADHYQFNASDMPEGGFENAQGDFWIAQPGGYLWRLKGQATGKNVVLNHTLDGQIAWDYQVEVIQEPLPLQPPNECAGQKPASDLPLPPGATATGGFAGALTFTSPDAPETVAGFYRQQLPTLGWKAVGETRGDSVIQLEYSRSEQDLKVIILREVQAGSSITLAEIP